MATQYQIKITNGVIEIMEAIRAPRKTTTLDAPNAKQWFAARGKNKPPRIKVRGWPFNAIYVTHGDPENGFAMAWSR